jgi:hypothetical protein
MTDKPTQKEMDDLFVEETGFDTDDFPAAIFGFARAVLEKWGTPAPVGAEPVALLVRKNSWRDGQWEAAPPNSPSYGLAWAHQRVYVYTTPQPTQAQAGAVPLTDAQIRAMLNKHPPEDVCGWSYRMGIDDAELHHGIKGGQHGTE